MQTKVVLCSVHQNIGPSLPLQVSSSSAVMLVQSDSNFSDHCQVSLILLLLSISALNQILTFTNLNDQLLVKTIKENSVLNKTGQIFIGDILLKLTIIKLVQDLDI